METLRLKTGKAGMLARIFHCHRNTITNAMRLKHNTELENAIRLKAEELGYIRE